MEGHLRMSQKERRYLLAMERVTKKEMTLAQASRQLQISYRQAQRLLCRYQEGGDAGLLHQARGKPSSHRKDPALKEAVLTLYREHYIDFGPTLAAEMLNERQGKEVHPETLRLWLIEAGLWQARVPKARHRTWRQRKACFGELVQLDGSVHAWFEGRGEKCFVMSMVDDATGTTLLLFAPQETTQAAMDLLEAWVRRYGIPQALYVDRKKVYLTDREPTPQEQLAGQEPRTQFGRACQKLGIRLVAAHSPQAKGRVERKHGLCQDRLIKEMRLERISDIAGGNAFLECWTPKINERFAVPARSQVDQHRPLPAGLELCSVLCQEEERTLGKDWTVRFQSRWFQILRQPDLPPVGSKVTVQARKDGSIRLRYKDRELLFAALPSRPERPQAVEEEPKTRPPGRPSADHPWRQSSVPRPFRPRPQEIGALVDTYLGPVPYG